MRISAGLSALALGAILSATPVMAASLNLGGNGGGLLGTGLLSGSNSQSSGNSGTSVNVNLSGGGDGGGNGGLLNLFGNGQGTTSASVNVGSGGGSSANVLLDLFGNGGDTSDAQVNLGVVGLGSGSDQAGAGDVTLDLFGDGSQSVGTVPGTTGGTGVEGGTGGGTGVVAGTNVASLGKGLGGSCFTPNANQLAKLVGRHAYDSATFDGWRGVTTIKVIRAGLCDAAAHNIAALPNIGLLQTHFGADATLRDQLAKWGHAPGDVIAADRHGSTLIVYVG